MPIRAAFSRRRTPPWLYSFYGRVEGHQVETPKLTLSAEHDQVDTVMAFTLGGLRDVLQWRAVEGGIGAGLTLYGVPAILRATHGRRPVSFQVFFRLRPAATGEAGRMWNMHMIKPMAPAGDPHAGHAMP
jgi:hypothetical protein